jgi:hypothetical protein
VGAALKKSPQFYFSEKKKINILFLFCLNLKGKRIYEEPPKVPSIFIFKFFYKHE